MIRRSYMVLSRENADDGGHRKKWFGREEGRRGRGQKCDVSYVETIG